MRTEFNYRTTSDINTAGSSQKIQLMILNVRGGGFSCKRNPPHAILYCYHTNLSECWGNIKYRSLTLKVAGQLREKCWKYEIASLLTAPETMGNKDSVQGIGYFCP